MNSFGFAAVLGFADALVARWNQMSSTRHMLILALVVLVFLALGLAVWAMFIHNPNHIKKSRHDRNKSEPEHHHRRKRKRRREHRPQNPTLADTGGLPPARDPNAGPRPEAGP